MMIFFGLQWLKTPLIFFLPESPPLIMAVLGIQLVTTMVAASIMSKVGQWHSLAR